MTESATPEPRRLSRLEKLILLAVALFFGFLVAATAWSAVSTLLWPSQPGQVAFTTVDPGPSHSCHFDNTVTTIQAGDHAWWIAVFQAPLDDKPLTLTVTLDGQLWRTHTYDAWNTKGLRCTSDRDDLSVLVPGVYRFTFTHDGEVEAEGTLTVK